MTQYGTSDNILKPGKFSNKCWKISILLITLMVLQASAALRVVRAEEPPEHISIYQLLSNPTSFHQKFVRVEGFMHVKMEDSALYANVESADYLITRNAIWLSLATETIDLDPLQKNLKFLSPRHFDEKFVLVEGIFNCEKHGHMGMFSGVLQQVSRVMEKRRYNDGLSKNPPPAEKPN